MAYSMSSNDPIHFDVVDFFGFVLWIAFSPFGCRLLLDDADCTGALVVEAAGSLALGDRIK